MTYLHDASPSIIDFDKILIIHKIIYFSLILMHMLGKSNANNYNKNI